MIYLEKNNQVMQKVNGFYNLKKDLEAVNHYQGEINSKFMTFNSYIERIKYLIDNNYYINFFSMYSEQEILIIKDIVYNSMFKFKSFMAISKFYRDYSLKSDDKQFYLENYQDRVIAAALYLAQGDVEKATNFAVSMVNQTFQPATPTFLNAGKSRRGELVSCFLLEIDDSLNSIAYNIGTSMQLSKIGGGVALNLSKLRAKGESIKQVNHACKGVVPVMKLLEDSFSYADQMGQRKGAGAAYLNIFHWDVEDFLDTKKINADEKSRIQTLSLGLIIPDKFMELAEKNKEAYLFAPLSVYKEYNKHLDDLDIDKMYEELVSNPNVIKKPINPRQFLIRIAQIQFESGYPYIVFKTTANNANPLSSIGQIKMSNLCTEIFQIQTTSTINDYNEPDDIGYDISCNLGSLNIANVMETNSIKQSVYAGMDALTAVSDLSHVKNAPGVEKANNDLHAVGLGAMNLHGFLAKNSIFYESDEARDFVRTFFMMVNYFSIKRSMMIAKERNKRFNGFEKSNYADGSYFNNYILEDYFPKFPFVASLFNDMKIPGKQEWKDLKRDTIKYGLYHSYRLAIAPTQSISYIQNATPSISPIVDHVEVRTYGNSTTYYPMPFLSVKNYFYYKSAYNIDMMNLIDLVAEIQPHIDQGISTVLYVTSNTSTRDLARLYIYAWKKGLKSLYYVRTKNFTIENCTSCSV